MESLNEIKEMVYRALKCASIIGDCELIIGLVGNVIACIVMLSSRSFHTLAGFYLLSISTADILILVTSILYDICYTKIALLKNLGAAPDFIDNWLLQTAIIVSTLTITAFTVERYLAICHPFFVRSLPTKSRVTKIIVAIWSVSALLALLPAAHSFLTDQVENEGVQRGTDEALPYLADVWAALFFFMPMSVMIVMYVLIWVKLKTRPNGKQTVGQADRADTKTLSMFVVIVAIFFISWAPYYIVLLLSSHLLRAKHRFFPKNDDTIIFANKFYLALIAKEAAYPLSSAMNPVIYSMMSNKFREAFKDLLSKVYKQLFDRLVRFINCRIQSNTSSSII